MKINITLHLQVHTQYRCHGITSLEVLAWNYVTVNVQRSWFLMKMATMRWISYIHANVSVDEFRSIHFLYVEEKNEELMKNNRTSY